MDKEDRSMYLPMDAPPPSLSAVAVAAAHALHLPAVAPLESSDNDCIQPRSIPSWLVLGLRQNYRDAVSAPSALKMVLQWQRHSQEVLMLVLPVHNFL